MKYIVIGAVVIAVAGAVFYFLMRGPSSVPPGGEAAQNPPATEAPSAAQTSLAAEPVPPVTELKIEDERIGTGAEAQSGLTVRVNYIGTLTDGTKFDSSYDRGQPLAFPLGQNLVIPGWEKGLIGMKVGGKRKLTIPPSMAYGSAGKGTIPPDATLIFDVELLAADR